MKGVIFIDSGFFDLNHTFSAMPMIDHFGLRINVDKEKNKNLEEILNDKEEFDKCLGFEIEALKQGGMDYDRYWEQANYIYNNYDKILEETEYINFSSYRGDIKEFLKNNPIINDKKIVLPEFINITEYDRIESLIEEYEDIIDRVYVCLEGNLNYVSLKDCIKTILLIENKVEEIKKLELSPMENIMYVYDQVRNRVYASEDEKDSSYKSRDLSEIMLGDKIVCLGYSMLFNVLLEQLGINSFLVNLDLSEDEAGHSRNVVYVNDPKYDIDGVYYFDSTWDSKKEEGNNSYLYGYKYFARTKKYMDEHDTFGFTDANFSEYSKDLPDKLESAFKNKDELEILRYGMSLNYMEKLLGGNLIITVATALGYDGFIQEHGYQPYIDKCRECMEKFEKEIPGETYLRVLNNVRKIEYHQNPEWYPYSINDMYRIYLNSDWQLTKIHLSKRDKFIKAVFDKELELNIEVNSIENYANFIDEENIFNEINQTKVSKTLKKVTDKKSS